MRPTPVPSRQLYAHQACCGTRVFLYASHAIAGMLLLNVVAVRCGGAMVAVQQVREAVVFCMGCGAEVPPRAASCPVCGRDTGRGGELRAAPPLADAYDGAAGASAMHDIPLEHAAPPVPVSIPVPIPAPVPPLAAGPSIGSGDLDQPGFPRDALGRSLIFTVLAMAADLLAPWVNLGGSRVAPSSL